MRSVLTGLILLFVLSSSLSAADSVILAIRDVPDDFFKNAIDDPSKFKHLDETYTVVGKVNVSDFEIDSINNVTVYTAKSIRLPLMIERSSIYREFDAISTMRIAFIVESMDLEAGELRLEWGEDVDADNVWLERIPIDNSNRGRYRTFGLEVRRDGTGVGGRATIKIIVDDDADKYYYWYLLPMAVVFGLLIMRKIYH